MLDPIGYQMIALQTSTIFAKAWENLVEIFLKAFTHRLLDHIPRLRFTFPVSRETSHSAEEMAFV